MDDLYIFVGRSGAGKGTQAALLEKKLKTIDPLLPVFLVETGRRFRELVDTDTYTGRRLRDTVHTGKLSPSFLGVHMWAQCLVQGYTGKGVVFMDGTPRKNTEVPLLLSAIKFYGWKAHVINLSVSDEWAYDHIKIRGRVDDLVSDEEIWSRIRWFHTSVSPAIEMLRDNPLIEIHDIYGEQSMEEVHADICYALGVPEFEKKTKRDGNLNDIL